MPPHQTGCRCRSKSAATAAESCREISRAPLLPFPKRNIMRIFFLLLLLSPAGASAQPPRAGLHLWLRADSGVQSSGNRVVRWADGSGNGHDAFARADRTAQWAQQALNGLPVLRFNGNTSGLQTKPFATFPKRRGTIVVVARVAGRSNTSGAGAGVLVSTYHGQGNTWELLALPQHISFYDGVSGSARPINASDKAWNIVTIVRNSDSTLRLYQRGRFSGELEVDANQPDTNALNIGFNGHGGNRDSIPEIFNGDIAEILYYNNALTEPELAAAHEYLARKWGIALVPPPLYERPYFYGAATLVLLAVAIALTRYLSVRKLKRRLRSLEQERTLEAERNRISKDMHDEIGSGLTQIALLSELMQAQERSREELLRDVSSISASARRLVQNMGEIVWTLNPQFDSLENLLAFLREQAGSYFEPFDIALKIDFPDTVPPVRLSNEERRNLFLVAKEAWNNAFKHAHAGSIGIGLQVQQRMLCFRVWDDGRGVSGTTRSGANGLRNMERRMLDIGGEFALHSSAEGTTVRFAIPLRGDAGV
ncbi:MAG: hypothetical protein EOO08_02140 [Chitinophagaceae bacterium]|nr:MAG: hypothetical protein EOO08_02140 [Chitinophagaceae bacterium]